MTIESSTYIGDWVAANPASTDPKSEGDDHIRKIKLDIQATFPGLIGRFRRTQSKSSAYTAVLNDNTSILVTSSTWTLSLTAAATLGNGWEIMVYNNGAGTITVDPNSSETINGATTLAIATNTYVWIACNGSSFFAAGSPTNSVNLVTTDTTQTITAEKTHNADLRIGTNTSSRGFHLNGPNGMDRSISFETAGSLRFWDVLDSSSESGSNNGSNRTFVRYADNGTTQLGFWLQVRRSDGAVQAGSAPTGGFAGADIWNFQSIPRVNNTEIALATGINQSVLGTTIRRKTADQTFTDSALSADSHLLFAIGANEEWIVEYYLVVTNMSTNGVNLSVAVPGGVTLIQSGFSVTGNGFGQSQSSVTTVSEGSNIFTAANFSSTTTAIALGTTYVLNGGTSGNVTLEATFQTGSSVTLKRGSYLVAHRIA